MGERLPCTQEVGGSIPPGSTKWYQVNEDHEVAINKNFDHARCSDSAKRKTGGIIKWAARNIGKLVL